MLIYLTDEIANIDLADTSNLSALENLLTAAHYGHHFILIDIGLTDWLHDNLNLFSQRARGVIRSSSRSYIQHAGLLSRINIKITVTLCDKIIKNTDGSFIVPVSYFDNMSMCYPTVLICEDLTDCSFYLKTANGYQVHSNLNRVTNINSENLTGGGSCALETLQESVEVNKRICCAILDSDKYSPDDKISDAAQNCLKFTGEADWPTNCLTTSSRELENIIPTRFIEDSYRTGSLNLTKLHALERDQDFWELLCFADYKVGTCVRWVLEKVDNKPQAKAFWLNLINKLEMINFIPDINECICESTDSCIRDNETDCDWMFFPPVSKNVLENVTNYLNGAGGHPHNIARDIRGRTEQELLSLSEFVFEWCCSQAPSRC